MGDSLLTPVDTASAVLVLSKATWRLGTSFSKLDHDVKPVDSALKNLAEDIKSLSTECDLIYAKLDKLAGRGSNDSSLPYDGDGRMFECLTLQVREASQTIQELEQFARSVRMGKAEETSLVYHSQHLMQLNKSRDQIEERGHDVRRHTDSLRITLLLIQTVFAHLAPNRADCSLYPETEKLQNMVKKLQRLSQVGPPWRYSHTEAMLMQYAREMIFKSTITQQAVEPAARSPLLANGNDRAPVWMETLEAIRKDQSSKSSDMGTMTPSKTTDELAHVVMQTSLQEHEGSDSDDDLNTDFTKAALSTGAHAFGAQDWEEADSLLQEGLRLLQQLPKRRRTFCDTFSLHYKLAICAYHTQEPTIAEAALNSLVQQSASNNEQHECIHNATHLLSQLYLRMGQIERAHIECEKALQARRRLLGKQSDASLQSMALMAHIYVLLNNRPLAKSCLAMIPEARRDAVLCGVESSLGTTVEHLEFSSLLSRAVPIEVDRATERARNRLSASTLGAPAPHKSKSDTGLIMSRSSAASPWKNPRSSLSEGTTTNDMHDFMKRSPPSAVEGKEWGLIEEEKPTQRHSLEARKTESTFLGPVTPLEAKDSSRSKTLTRKELLNKVGCQPRDRTEEAVCDGDYSGLTTILNKKKGFWRSSVRKRGRPERVTALHFAALFGEVEMARRLVEAGFNVNEVPFGYSTTLTPLNFAVGARQVAMVDFLTANGAKPAEPDTWSTLAAQLMSRSWLVKTMSESEKDLVPDRIVAIMNALLRHGWLINAPIATSGNTVLHQAVAFWTGAYTWDLKLRTFVTSFLCERDADPFQANAEGKTPYDMASASGHQDLLSILEHCSRRKELYGTTVMPVELPGYIQ